LTTGNKNYGDFERNLMSKEGSSKPHLPKRNFEYFLDESCQSMLKFSDDDDDDREGIISRNAERSNEDSMRMNRRYENNLLGTNAESIAALAEAGYDSNGDNSDTEGFLHSNNNYNSQSSVPEEGELSRFLLKSKFCNERRQINHRQNK